MSDSNEHVFVIFSEDCGEINIKGEYIQEKDTDTGLQISVLIKGLPVAKLSRVTSWYIVDWASRQSIYNPEIALN